VEGREGEGKREGGERREGKEGRKGKEGEGMDNPQILSWLATGLTLMNCR